MEVNLALQPLCQSVPVDGSTLFTDGSGQSGKAVIVWYDGSNRQHQIHQTLGSPQIVELHAIVQVFTHWQEPLNLVTHSQHVMNVVTRLEKAWLKHVDNEPLFSLFKCLWDLLRQRTNPYYVLHIRSHTSLSGIITEGNARVHWCEY